MLVDSARRAKVSDFGMSRDIANSDNYYSRHGAVPVRWTAPETLENRRFTVTSDIWSVPSLLLGPSGSDMPSH